MKKLIIIYIIMLVFTAIVAVVSQTIDSKMAIMFLSAAKFILLAFYFMELIKTHIVWRVLITGFLTVFVILILAIHFG